MLKQNCGTAFWKATTGICDGRRQPGVGIRMAVRKTDDRPGTDTTMHFAGVRSERPGMRAGWSRHLEMFRHDRARIGQECMYQKRGAAADMRDATKGIDDPNDVHCGKRQQKRRNTAGKGIGTRATNKRASGKKVHLRHFETNRSIPEKTKLGIPTGSRACDGTTDIDGLRGQHLDNRKNSTGDTDSCGRNRGRNEDSRLETGRDGELLINKHVTQRPPPGLNSIHWNGADLQIVEGMKVLGFRLNAAGTDTEIRR